MGGQWRSGGCLFGQATWTGSGSKESAEHQRDRHQAPTQTQTPQHHHVQVSRTQTTVLWLTHSAIHSHTKELRNAAYEMIKWSLLPIYHVLFWRASFCTPSEVYARRPRVTASSWSTVHKGSCMRCWEQAGRSNHACSWTGPWASPGGWTICTSTRSSTETWSPQSELNEKHFRSWCGAFYTSGVFEGRPGMLDRY